MDNNNKIFTKNIDLIVYDFDGVMTNNCVLILQDGTEGVLVNRADGMGVNMIRDMGINQLILSTETNPVVSVRAKKLKLEVIQGSANKQLALTEYCANHHIDLSRVLYVGNDINDLGAMQLVGYTVAPKDAHPQIIALATIITKTIGGDGVIRELAEQILV